jgi:dienelactone hydrolase
MFFLTTFTFTVNVSFNLFSFGGTGSIDYAFSNSSSNSAFEGVKAVVPIHGGLSPLRPIQTSDVEPYILILSGGVDDAHGNTTELEMHLDSTDATWEITRYSSKQSIIRNSNECDHDRRRRR